MELKIGWLYPNLMNTYGDRGNIIALAYRIQKRDIKVKLLKISLADNPKLILSSDLLFMGGAQDKQQEIVNQDLMVNKKEYLTVKIEKGTPGLYICAPINFGEIL
jgi:CobQ-like glutamine amidotransferase family enzyme